MKYVISNLEGFANSIRENAAKSFAENYTENLDDFISINQVVGLIKEQSDSITEDNQIIITEDNFNNIFDEIRVRLYEVGLARLASKGYIDCAWNSETNEMEFWLVDENSTKIESRPSNL